MNAVSNLVDRLGTYATRRLAVLRPVYPPVAIELDADGIVLVRLKRGRRGATALEAHRIASMPEDGRAASIFRPMLGPSEEISKRIREAFEATGTKPGRVSVVLPDNLAKVSLLQLPERPASSRHLDEIVRFKLRRAVPFRLDEAVLTYQVLDGESAEVNVLVAVLRRGVVEQYERMIEAAGARPGLIDLCTPNLVNLCRPRIAELAAGGADVALLNCAAGYFSLVIVRAGNLIFYRCKSLPAPEEQAERAVLTREVANSIAYYREKLGGDGLDTVLVRTVSKPLDELRGKLSSLGFARVEAVDPSSTLGLGEGLRLDPAMAQRIAPAVGAAAGRGRP